jgi:signal transduction histidine kinase
MATSSGTNKLSRSDKGSLANPRGHSFRKINFTVDSALLRELGERLVGQPHIALAELVKNGYDADATKVIIRFSPQRIEVTDNGHGMTFDEFESFWMRIGSPHKQEQVFSKKFKRPVTGSKGVGRLASQFLARKLELRTVSRESKNQELVARVNWDEAVDAGELTEATALWEVHTQTTEFPGGSPHGTSVILSDLNQVWSSDDFERLALEIWALQPPFKGNPHVTSDIQKQFSVDLESPYEEDVEKFEAQMRAALDLWEARLLGRLVRDGRYDIPTVQLLLEYEDRRRITWEYPIPECSLSEVEFEIRIYKLQNRLRHGIKVGVARDYFREFGGVHVYDAGFHLPYYGPDTDWLDIEVTHSHRLTRSELLPPELQIERGLQFLPTQQRIFGVVHVNTSRERIEARKRGEEKKGEYLKIQVTRDRLVVNKAFDDLYAIVNTALHFYAVQQQRRRLEEIERIRPVESVSEKFGRVDQVLALYQPEIPEPVFEKLKDQVEEAIHASETEAEAITKQIGLLGSLATAGMSAMAYEHEVTKQFHLLENVTEELNAIKSQDRRIQHRIENIAEKLKEWIERARATRAVFSFLMDEDNRNARARFKAKSVVDQVVSQMGMLLRGVTVETTEIDDRLRLPMGGYAEWSAVFQNVFLNAANAMLDAEVRYIAVSSHTRGRTRVIVVQDTGSGVDLETAEDLFKPFIRKLEISPERRALGLGGTGLGLAIVKMIAVNLNCTVSFEEPDEGFSTAFQISWNEQQ